MIYKKYSQLFFRGHSIYIKKIGYTSLNNTQIFILTAISTPLLNDTLISDFLLSRNKKKKRISYLADAYLIF